MSIMTTMNSPYDSSSSTEESCPDYDAAMYSARPRGLPPLPSDDGGTSLINPPRRLIRPLQRNEVYVYRYALVVAAIPIEVLITVLPSSGRPADGKYTFKLSLRINKIERSLCEPEERKLLVDPRQLEFDVLMVPGKTTLPIGGLWSLRVWLQVNGINHKLFGEDEVWIAKDMDLKSIPHASIARHKFTNPKKQVYYGFLGHALVDFIVRWSNTSYGTIKYSLEYEAGGVSSTLFDDLELCTDHDPKNIAFEIYATPGNSRPAGSSHKLRVWLRSPINTGVDPAIAMPPYNDGSFVYQRVWKSDSFKIGSHLDFESLANVIIGRSKGGPQRIIPTSSPFLSPSLHARIPPNFDPSIQKNQAYSDALGPFI